MKRHLFVSAFLFVLTLAAAISFPQLTGRVVDEAGLLSPEREQALSAKLEALENNTTDQVVVVTLASLNGYDIADYGYRLGRHWGIGQKGKDNGVLLIVAPNERKVRIEVGYGLEGVLTDAKSSRIIQNRILPAFKRGDFSGGIEAGVDAIVSVLRYPGAEIPRDSRKGGNDDIGSFFFFFVVFVFPVFLGALKTYRNAFRSGILALTGGGLLYFAFDSLPVAGIATLILFIVAFFGRTGGTGGWVSSGSGGWSGGGSSGGFSGGGGSFGGGGASGSW